MILESAQTRDGRPRIPARRQDILQGHAAASSRAAPVRLAAGSGRLLLDGLVVQCARQFIARDSSLHGAAIRQRQMKRASAKAVLRRAPLLDRWRRNRRRKRIAKAEVDRAGTVVDRRNAHARWGE